MLETRSWDSSTEGQTDMLLSLCLQQGLKFVCFLVSPKGNILPTSINYINQKIKDLWIVSTYLY